MDDDELARRFEEHRARVTATGRTMLGPTGPVDDAVREAWAGLPTRTQDVLETLPPAERLTFVLHDLIGMPLEEIAPILGRTSSATEQLAGRARRRVRSPERTLEADRAVQGRVVDAFLTASGTGDLEELVWLLHPDAVLHADAAAVAAGAVSQTHGAQAVAETFAGRARAARPALLDGFAAAVRAVDGLPRVVFGFTVVEGRIAEIELVTDADVLRLLDLVQGSAAP